MPTIPAITATPIFKGDPAALDVELDVADALWVSVREPLIVGEDEIPPRVCVAVPVDVTFAKGVVETVGAEYEVDAVSDGDEDDVVVFAPDTI